MSKPVTVSISTVANTSGITQTEAALDDLDKTTHTTTDEVGKADAVFKDLEKTTHTITSGVGRIDDALEGLEDTAKTTTGGIKRTTAEFMAMSDKAKVSTFAFYDLDAALKHVDTRAKDIEPSTRKVTQSLATMTTATKGNEKGLKSMQMGVQNASYQVADLAVQLGGGVSATRALSQQLPQLLGGFGVWGAAAGAAVAVVGGALEALMPKTKSAQEEMTAITEATQTMLEAIKNLATEALDKRMAAIDSTENHADALRQTWAKTKAAEADATTSAINNQRAQISVMAQIDAWLGKQVDHYRNLRALANLDAASRNEQAQQAVDAQKLAQQQAVSAAASAENAMLARNREVELAKIKLAELKEAYDEVLERQRVAIDITKQTPSVTRQVGMAIGIASASKDLSPKEQQKFDIEAGSLVSQMRETQKFIDDMLKPGGQLDSLKVKAEKANTEMEDTLSAANQSIETITANLAAQETTAKFGQLEQTASQYAKDVGDFASNIETSTATGKQALDAVKASLADGKIQADETLIVAENMRTLIGQIQSGQASFSGNLGSLIALMTAYQRDMATMTSQVSRIAAEQKATSARINQIVR